MRKAFLISLLFLTSCKVGPNYIPPTEEVSDCWHSPNFDVFVMDNPNVCWWDIFEDDLLKSYIQEAATFNKDVQIAEANLMYARASRDFEASYFYPRIDHDFNVTRQAFSKNGPLVNFPNTMNPNQMPTVSIPRYQTIYNFTFDAIWELDLFGKTARRVESADATIGSALANLNDVMLSVFAEIAKNYVEVRSAQEQQRLIEKNLKLLEQNVNLTKKRVEGGLENGLNLERVEAEYADLKSSFPVTFATIYSGIYNISILIGRVPEELLEEMLLKRSLPHIPEKVTVGLRSEILMRRPDVRRAERDLHAAVANIGAAKAEFFPKITLTGTAGLQSLEFKKLFQKDSFLWAYGADVLTPIFHGGKLKANLTMAKAKAFEQIAEYEKTVLNALRDAERALISYSQDLATLKDQTEVVQKTEKIVVLSQKRYKQGLTNLTDFIDSERDLIHRENALLQTKQQALIDLISLYKALGGCF